MVGDQALKEVYDLAEAMNKFGPAIIVLAVFILIFLAVMLLFIRSYSNSTKSSQDTFSQMMQQQQQVFSYLLKEKDNEEAKPVAAYDEKKIVEIFCRLNIHLKSECKKFLDKTECDRIGVYVFHNGTVASHGLPFLK